ncbi:WXG100 family type VII secretion target [Nocardioides sp. SYSU D00038]|uniref:WXG100 family type VII secretion target n=1 Tax=Nocardioides sp. SYSU D00038 TaxID=2812554 RepID=UPI001967B5F6|nr:WXG100 family type VII secretion target [Nocardioides sp. SYSU D00038]
MTDFNALDGILVQHAGLDQAGADLHQMVKDIDDRMNRLESELQPLRHEWHGEAQNAYTAAKAKWDWAILQMRNLLDETGQTVYQSNSEYRAADVRGANQFTQM